MNTARENLGALLRRRMNAAMGHPFRRSASDKVNRVRDMLKRNGWVDIREGCKGAFTLGIMLSPCGTMIAKFSSFSDFYPEWIKWVATQSNPHLPQIYRAQAIAGGRYFLTIMERLEHLPGIGGYYDEAAVEKAWPLARYVRYEGIDFDALIALGMGRLAKIILTAFDKFGRFNDCHFGNMMLRGDTLVITDPYCGFPSRAVYNRRPLRNRCETCGATV